MIGTTAAAARLEGARAPANVRAWALCGLAAAAAWLALRAWGSAVTAIEPFCWLRATAHVACPTCGMTRALVELSRGHLSASLALHPMAALLALQLFAGWLAWGAALRRGRAIAAPRWLGIALAANGLAFLLIWLARLITGTLPA